MTESPIRDEFILVRRNAHDLAVGKCRGYTAMLIQETNFCLHRISCRQADRVCEPARRETTV
jgi:hypothetical protein